ncbi:sugar porter family MFS transporter [Acidipila sp. EB88]|uniref:sugar porter family MFS transporter n=1 Tax=Acidipila sp. EB88 TaxID=2305226 RepID=UPI000F5F4FC9|nr:sugar porter family MFS transporter [Acidipila sp. EB88]RRA49784.1 sugar porter family MFS transporter [Acidipila sp. EB88]
MRLTSLLLKSALVGALGGLLFGFDTAVISGTTHQLTQIFTLSASQLGLTVSIALFGTVLGALTSGNLGQRIGSREALRLMAVLYVISAIGTALSWNWPSLLVFRFIGGLGIGGSSVLGPVYIAEMAPARIRGRLVGLFQTNIVIGILLAYGSNYLLENANLGAKLWRWELGVASFPALLFLALLFQVPRSARWLLSQNRVDEARAALGLLGAEDPQAEIDELRSAIRADADQRSAPLFTRSLRLPIFLAISIGLFNQLAGINAILYYLNDIFRAGGFSSVSSDEQAVIIGAVNLVSTLLALSVIDRIGRKTLLLVGSVGTALSLGGVAYVFTTHQHLSLLLWLLVSFIFFFAFSQGAVIWVYISEVFPTRVRSKGQSLGSGSHWVANAIISFAFPVIARHSAGAPFIFFSAMMVLQFFVVLFVYPETKGVSLEQLQKQLGTNEV